MAMEDSEPAEVLELVDLLSSLPGITNVDIVPFGLVNFNIEELRFSVRADLPSAALRRTAGGLAGEFLVQVWLDFAPVAESWHTLEFLAWHVRDAARSGDVTQMRVRGLPPSTGAGVQLGTTLRFVIEWFIVNADQHPNAIAERLRQEIKSLRSSIDIYGHLLGGASGK